MLGFKCKEAVMERSHAAATRPSRPQQPPSSSAGAAQPHASSSEPAPTIRTPVERSRGGRSPRARQASQLRRLSTPHPLVQEALVLVVPASHSRLADEAGHDGEAGTVIVHHGGAVHDVEAPAQASSQHSCMWPALLIAPHVLSTRKVSSKLATSTSSSTAVGEKVARTYHGRGHVLAPPPRATRAPRPTGVGHRAKHDQI